MYLNTVFKYNVFKYCPALVVIRFLDYNKEITLKYTESYKQTRSFEI